MNAKIIITDGKNSAFLYKQVDGELRILGPVFAEKLVYMNFFSQTKLNVHDLARIINRKDLSYEMSDIKQKADVIYTVNVVNHTFSGKYTKTGEVGTAEMFLKRVQEQNDRIRIATKFASLHK